MWHPVRYGHPLGMRRLASVGMLLSSGCILRQHYVAPPQANACEVGWEPIISNTVHTLIADRAHENRFHLPWTDTLPPRPIRGPQICARAGRTYAGVSDGSVAPPTGVVQAGGLYFVVATPADRAGEWMVIAVLDKRFRYIIGVTT